MSKVCLCKGITEEQIIEAVKNGVFHIYPISHINEGIELLMQYPIGKKDNFGKFPKDSVHGKVYAKLKSFAQLSSIKL